MRKKINTVRQKINTENSHQPDILLSANFGGDGGINFIFSINLNFAINLGDNFSKKIRKRFHIFSLKFLPKFVHKNLINAYYTLIINIA